MTSTVLYDQMVTAIAACEQVDEAKDIRDKAVALEVYYRQAGNFEAERKAANVRIRAEVRSGELLEELGRADHDRGNQYVAKSNDGTQPPSPYASTLARLGMSRQQAHRFQSLARVPKDIIEAALADPASKPTSNGILARAQLRVVVNPQPKVSDEALWLWGHLRDFESKGYLSADWAPLLDGMTDGMRADVLRLAPRIAEFLSTLEDCHERA